MISKNVKPGYMIQLDSLRALAVFGVMIEHFIPGSIYASFLSAWGGAFPLEWGSGVTLFFVLSGFLITGILLRCKDIIRTTKQSIEFTLKRFYIRRFLRIFPIYYLSLVVTAFIFTDAKNEYIWHFSYLSNIRIFLQESWNGYATHFWTLAMEEQFYLIWPLVILIVPKKYLLKSIFFTIIIAPLFRFVGCYCLHLSIIQIIVFPLSSLDSFGLGALLAYYSHNIDRHKQAKVNLSKIGVLVCLPLMILFTIISFAYKGTVLLNILIKPTVLSLFFVWIISSAAEGFKGKLGAFLETKLLTHIGKISYGIYVYHYFIGRIIDKVLDHYTLSSLIPLPVIFIVKVLISLAIANLSWIFIEKPINNLKSYFSYHRDSKIV